MSENASVEKLKNKIESLELEMAAYRQSVQALLKGRGFELTARSIFSICRKLFGATTGYIALLENGAAEKGLQYFEAEDACRIKDPYMHMPLRGLRAEAYRHEKVVYCNRVSENGSGRFVPEGHVALKNVMFVPLVVEEKPIGLIGLANKETDFSDKDACRAKVFGELAATALRNARAYEEREKNERSLLESEQKFRMMFRTSPDSISINRLCDGMYLDVNDSFEKLTKFRREEVLGKTTREIGIWQDPGDRESMLAMLNRDGSVENFEIRFRVKNGEIRTGLLSAQILRMGHEDVILSVTRDITDRKQSEQKLRESEAKYRQIVDSAPAGIYEVDLETLKFIHVNEIICRYSGYSEAEILSMNLFDLLAEESRPVLAERFGKVRAGEMPPRDVEYKVRKKDGGYLWVLANVSFFSANGRITRATAVVQDITERKRIEEELRVTANNLALATEAAEMGFWSWDVRANIMAWDNRMCRLYGVRPEDFNGADADWKRFVHPEDLAGTLSALQEAVQARGKLHVQFRVVCPDGRIRILECHAVVLCDSDGEPQHMIGVSRDITDRKEREKNLRFQKELLQSILDNIPLMVCFLDPDLHILWVNRTWEQKLGWSFSESRGIEIFCDLYPDPQMRGLVFDCIQKADGLWREFQTRIRNGNCIDTRWTKVKLSDGTIICIGEDVSERKKEERELVELKNQLVQAQKMEAIGTLAGGIAHDFNNLLFPILGYAEMLKDDLSHSSPLRNSVDQILMATKRATELVRQILTFSRQSDREIRPLKIQTILKEVVKLGRSTLPATIEVVQDVDPNCGYVLADPTQIHQLIMNLITNAYHAMDHSGGVLTITLCGAHLDRTRNRQLQLDSGHYIKLSVKDTGVGMDDAILARIFEPYFTTKSIDKGTGLGLPVVHGIVKNLKGDILVESTPGKGTTFEVYLPEYCGRAESGTADVGVSEDAFAAAGGERILLVDDDAPILKMEKKMLENLGYEVRTFLDSIDALEAFRADPQAYDLVMTDMTMPRVTGDLLAKACMEIREDIPVILCTGFSEKVDAAGATRLGIRGFLSKPFVRQELVDLLRKALG